MTQPSDQVPPPHNPSKGTAGNAPEAAPTTPHWRDGTGAQPGYGPPQASYGAPPPGPPQYGQPLPPPGYGFVAPPQPPPTLRRRTGLLIGLISAGLVLVSVVVAGALVLTADDSPGEVVDTFLEHWLGGDAHAAAQHVCVVDRRQLLRAAAKPRPIRPGISWRILDERIDRLGRTAEVDFAFVEAGEIIERETGHLIRESGDWRICEHDYD